MRITHNPSQPRAKKSALEVRLTIFVQQKQHDQPQLVRDVNFTVKKQWYNALHVIFYLLSIRIGSHRQVLFDLAQLLGFVVKLFDAVLRKIQMQCIGAQLLLILRHLLEHLTQVFQRRLFSVRCFFAVSEILQLFCYIASKLKYRSRLVIRRRQVELVNF